jgi:hypothetical protein
MASEFDEDGDAAKTANWISELLKLPDWFKENLTKYMNHHGVDGEWVGSRDPGTMEMPIDGVRDMLIMTVEMSAVLEKGAEAAALAAEEAELEAEEAAIAAEAAAGGEEAAEEQAAYAAAQRAAAAAADVPYNIWQWSTDAANEVIEWVVGGADGADEVMDWFENSKSRLKTPDLYGPKLQELIEPFDRRLAEKLIKSMSQGPGNRVIEIAGALTSRHELRKKMGDSSYERILILVQSAGGRKRKTRKRNTRKRKRKTKKRKRNTRKRKTRKRN